MTRIPFHREFWPTSLAMIPHGESAPKIPALQNCFPAQLEKDSDKYPFCPHIAGNVGLVDSINYLSNVKPAFIYDILFRSSVSHLARSWIWQFLRRMDRLKPSIISEEHLKAHWWE